MSYFVWIRNRTDMLLNHRTIIFVIFLISLFVSPFVCFSQEDITVSSSVDKQEITIGDKIHYKLKITHGKDIKVDSPKPGANLGQFDILDFKENTPVEKEGKITEVIDYIISNYDIGDYKIPPLTITYKNKKGEPKELKTNEITIKVKSVVNPQEKDIRDIKDVAIIPIDYSPYIKLGIGLVILIILIISLIYYIRYRRRKANLSLEDISVKYPPHEQAYMSLKALEEKGFIEKGKIKEFYIEFSDIIRTFIARRYEVDALERTTYELMELLKDSDIETQNTQLLNEILDESDFVKYAKYIPSKEIIDGTFRKAYDFVDITKKIITLEPIAETQPAVKE
jgi:hypothetical protein